MRRSRRTSVAMGVVVGMFIVAIAWRWYGRQHHTTLPLSVHSTDLKVGPIEAAFKSQHELNIYNVTSRMLRIDDVLASCACLEIEPRSFVIGPRDSATIMLTINSISFVTQGDSPTILGRVDISPIIAGERVATWPIMIKIFRPSVVITSPELDFGVVVDDGGEFIARTLAVIFVAGDEDVPEIRADSELVRSVSLARLAPETEFYDRYRPQLVIDAAQLTSGGHRLRLAITERDGKRRFVVAKFLVDTLLRIHVLAEPSSVVGRSDSLNWVFSVTSDKAILESMDVAVNSEHEAHVAQYVDALDGTHYISVELTPKWNGDVSGDVEVACTTSSGEVLRASIPLFVFVFDE